MTKVPLPGRGEVWTTDLEPPTGHEQGGFRPALVISVDPFNRSLAEMVIVLPLTTQARPHAYHVPLAPPEGGVKAACFVKCEDVRAISTLRLGQPWGRVSPATIAEVEDRLRMILGL